MASSKQHVAVFPHVTSVLCRFIRSVLPKHKFTAVMLAGSQVTLTHRDSFNEPCSKSAVITLEEFEGAICGSSRLP